MLGNYSDDVTALGTLAQLALSMAGLDLPMDIRDLYYDVTNWEWTPEHLFQTLTDAVGFLPLVGSLKYVDEAADLLGSTDEFGALAKGAGKLGDTLGSMDEAADLLENVPEMADLLKGVPESGDLLGSADELVKGMGDYSNLAEKAKNIDVSTSAHQAVFYSGAGNRARAEAFAKLNGKTTLEMTPGGKYFESLKLFDPGSPITKDQAREIWEILSERYAKTASGNVYGFVKGSKPGSIFNTVEYQALQKNPYITNIFTELLN
ncbi:MAG TPA: hypothetical protein VN369_06275 [Terriglobales bacterium]|nr:hypothetical protein [Terriglobales bacterium]